MQWLIDNWFLVLVLGGMGAMHLFGHGHGAHGKQGKKPKADDTADVSDTDQKGG